MAGTARGREDTDKYTRRQMSLPHWFNRRSQNHSCNGEASSYVQMSSRDPETCVAYSWSLRKSKGRARCPDTQPLLAILPIFGSESLLGSQKKLLFSRSPTQEVLFTALEGFSQAKTTSPGEPGTPASGVLSCLDACHWRSSLSQTFVFWKYVNARHCFFFF